MITSFIPKKFQHALNISGKLNKTHFWQDKIPLDEYPPPFIPYRGVGVYAPWGDDRRGVYSIRLPAVHLDWISWLLDLVWLHQEESRLNIQYFKRISLRRLKPIWTLAPNSNFLIPISLQSDVTGFWYFKLWILLNKYKGLYNV